MIVPASASSAPTANAAIARGLALALGVERNVHPPLQPARRVVVDLERLAVGVRQAGQLSAGVPGGNAIAVGVLQEVEKAVGAESDRLAAHLTQSGATLTHKTLPTGHGLVQTDITYITEFLRNQD